MKISLKHLYLFTVCFVLINSIVWGGTTGKISGRIVDKTTGEPLPLATVQIEGTNLGGASDNNGQFVIINIPPGTYNLVFTYVGFTNLKIEKVIVNADRTTRQDAQMTSGNISVGEIVVSAKREAIEKDRTYSASIVNADAINNMPVTSVSEVIKLQPGVVSSGGALHFRGGREREVAYLIDGVPVSNSFNQSGGNNVDIENSMIQELEVISGTFNAEYGSAQSGIVNIITKRTAPIWSGSVKYYMGDWLSTKDNVFLGVKNFDPANEKDVQFSLSGPVFKDKLGFSFFGRVNNSNSLSWYEKRFNSLDGWKIAAYQRWYQKYRSNESSQTQAVEIPDSLMTGDGSQGPMAKYLSTSYNAKLNYYPIDELNLSYQFFGSYNKSEGSTSSSKRYQPDGSGESKDWSLHHFLSIHHVLSKNFFYNLNFSYQHNTGESYYRKDNKVADFPGDDGIQPVTYSTDGFSLGETDGFFTGKDGKNYRDVYFLSGNFSYQLGKINYIKAGFEFKKHEVNTYSWGYVETKDWETKKWLDLDVADISFPDYWNVLVDYWKNWDNIYDTTKYRKYNESEYSNWRDYTIKPTEFSSYIQDKVELGEIIINGGLRFDLFKPNEKVPINYRTESYGLGSAGNLTEAKTKYQLSPRLGISFPISEKGVFHAAYGHFFQMPSFEKMFNEPLYVLTPLQLEGRLLGNADLEPEKTIQYEIGLQQQITDDIAVDITAYYKDFKNLLGVEKLTTIDAVGYERYINRDYGNSKGITIGLRKTEGMITGSLNYTLSYANGSSSDPNALQLIYASTQIGGDPVTFVDRKILPLSWDQQHTLNLIVNVTDPKNWSLGLVAFIKSGQPYDPVFIEKYDVLAREYQKSALKPVQWNVDLKAKKNFYIGDHETVLFLKIDNLFDHLNQNDVYSNSGTADRNVRIPATEALEREKLRQENAFTLDEVDSRPEWYSEPRKVQFGFEFYF